MKLRCLGLLLAGLVGCGDTSPQPGTATAPPTAQVEGLSPAAPPPLEVLDLRADAVPTSALGGGLSVWQGRLAQVVAQDSQATLLLWQAGAVVQRLPLGVPAEEGHLLVIPDGLAWIPATQRRVVRIDPAQATVAHHALPLASGARVVDAAATEADLWILSGGVLLHMAASGSTMLVRDVSVPAALSHQGTVLWIAEARADGRGGLWQRTEGAAVLRMVVDEPTPEHLLATQDGGAAVVGATLARQETDGRLRWRVPSPGAVVALAETARHLAVLTGDRLRLYASDTGAVDAEVAVQDAVALARTSEGDLVVAEGGGLSLLEADTGRLAGRWAAAPTPAQVLADASGDRVVLDVQGGLLSIWPEGSADLEPLPGTGRPLAMAVAPHGGLAVLDQGGVLNLWQVAQRAHLGRVALADGGGAGRLAVDPDRAVAVVGRAASVAAVDLREQAVVWRVPLAGDAVAVGGGQVFALDATARLVTALSLETGAVVGSASLVPARPGRHRGEAVPLREAALLYDASTDRLFCGRVVLDGRTLAQLAVLPGVDRVVWADQRVVVARKDGVSGTRSVVLLDATSLAPLQRTPLVQQAEGADALTYDAERHRLYLAEPSRSRVLTWPFPP